MMRCELLTGLSGKIFHDRPGCAVIVVTQVDAHPSIEYPGTKARDAQVEQLWTWLAVRTFCAARSDPGLSPSGDG